MSIKRMGLVLALLLLPGVCSGCQPVLAVLDAVNEQKANEPDTEVEMVEIIEVPPQEAAAQEVGTPVFTPGPSPAPAVTTPSAPPQTASTPEPAVSAPASTVPPTAKPTVAPTAKPTAEPTAKPTEKPTAKPTVEPTAKPTVEPTERPTAPPQTPAPTPEPIPITIFADPTPAPTPEPVTGGEYSSSSAERIIAMTNQQRAANGVGELRESSALQRAARTRAQELTVSFSHTRPDGSSALSISSAAYAENIAYGLNMSDAEIMNGWMNSSGHRTNILNPSYSTIGVGCYTMNGYVYYVQLFGY